MRKLFGGSRGFGGSGGFKDPVDMSGGWGA